MIERKPPDAFAVSLMLLLCIVWGLQQVAIKLAAPHMMPVLQLGLRSLVAALLVALLMVCRGTRPASDEALGMPGTLLPGLGAGLLFALEFLCVALGLEYTSAAHMSVFLYTAPVFTVLGLHLLVPGERLAPLQWLGVLTSFAGIALAFSSGWGASASLLAMLKGDALGVLAGLLWGATTVLIRASALSEAPPSTTLLYQLGSCGVILLAIAVGSGQARGFSMTGVVWSSLIFQSVVIGFASYLAWFWMLRRYLASRLAVFSFLTPLFGVGFGIVLLHDVIDPRFGFGALLVLAGVLMVNLRRR